MQALQADLGLDHQAHLITGRPNEPGSMSLLSGSPPSDVVFLSVDLEAYEFAQDKVTEIGISVFDARFAVSPPSTWVSQIKSRHALIAEHRRFVNKKWVQGCPDAFNFGNSELVRLREVRAWLTKIFENPCGASGLDVPTRQIVLVGHGLQNDIDYLQKFGFSPAKGGNIARTLDTQSLFPKKSIPNMQRVLHGLGVEPRDLHNAGNDAYYTLQAMLLMAIQHTEEPGACMQRIKDVVLPETFKQRRKREVAERKRAMADKIEAAKQAKLAAQEGDAPATGADGGHLRSVGFYG